MEQKKQGGRPKRKTVSAPFYVRVDAELLKQWTDSLGSRWRTKRQRIIERMMREWIENPYESRATILPRRVPPSLRIGGHISESMEDYIKREFFSGRSFTVVGSPRVNQHIPGWIIELKIVFMKIAAVGEEMPEQVIHKRHALDTQEKERATEIARQWIVRENEQRAREKVAAIRSSPERPSSAAKGQSRNCRDI